MSKELVTLDLSDIIYEVYSLYKTEIFVCPLLSAPKLTSHFKCKYDCQDSIEITIKLLEKFLEEFSEK